MPPLTTDSAYLAGVGRDTGQTAARSALGRELQFPQDKVTKVIPCSGCGRDMQVSERTVMAFCANCSATMGVKK